MRDMETAARAETFALLEDSEESEDAGVAVSRVCAQRVRRVVGSGRSGAHWGLR
jgi:hypothetical protein